MVSDSEALPRKRITEWAKARVRIVGQAMDSASARSAPSMPKSIFTTSTESQKEPPAVRSQVVTANRRSSWPPGWL